MEMSATVRWRPRTARGEAVKADDAPGLESRVRGNVQARVCAVRRVVVSLLQAGGTEEKFLGYWHIWR
jgi:hypothetical protein